MSEHDGPMTVGQVADRFGLTVRTLHHYDALGLVEPSTRTLGGYRLYADADLERLATVVAYRRLGFGLGTIATLLADETQRRAHLIRQREAVEARITELGELAAALDHALEQDMDHIPTHDELTDLFGSEGFSDDYAAEAEERWGDTDAWRQSQARTARMTKAEWAQVKADGDALLADLVSAHRAGVAPDSDEAAVLAERHRASIEQFYDCSYAMQVALAEMYLADPRFTAHYDGAEPGTAQWLHDAVVSNAARHV